MCDTPPPPPPFPPYWEVFGLKPHSQCLMAHSHLINKQPHLRERSKHPPIISHWKGKIPKGHTCTRASQSMNAEANNYDKSGSRDRSLSTLLNINP